MYPLHLASSLQSRLQLQSKQLQVCVRVTDSSMLTSLQQLTHTLQTDRSLLVLSMYFHNLTCLLVVVALRNHRVTQIPPTLWTDLVSCSLLVVFKTYDKNCIRKSLQKALSLVHPSVGSVLTVHLVCPFQMFISFFICSAALSVLQIPPQNPQRYQIVHRASVFVRGVWRTEQVV